MWWRLDVCLSCTRCYLGAFGPLGTPCIGHGTLWHTSISLPTCTRAKISFSQRFKIWSFLFDRPRANQWCGARVYVLVAFSYRCSSKRTALHVGALPLWNPPHTHIRVRSCPIAPTSNRVLVARTSPVAVVSHFYNKLTHTHSMHAILYSQHSAFTAPYVHSKVHASRDGVSTDDLTPRRGVQRRKCRGRAF